VCICILLHINNRHIQASVLAIRVTVFVVVVINVVVVVTVLRPMCVSKRVVVSSVFIGGLDVTLGRGYSEASQMVLEPVSLDRQTLVCSVGLLSPSIYPVPGHRMRINTSLSSSSLVTSLADFCTSISQHIKNGVTMAGLLPLQENMARSTERYDCERTFRIAYPSPNRMNSHC